MSLLALSKVGFWIGLKQNTLLLLFGRTLVRLLGTLSDDSCWKMWIRESTGSQSSPIIPCNPDNTRRKVGGGGGSRTPVRKALRPEAYMLISIRCATQPVRAYRAFARRGQNEQETQLASPMNLARTLRTERLGPAHCVTPLAGPMSKARGSVRLIN